MLKDDEIARDSILPSVARLQEAGALISSSILARVVKGDLGALSGEKNLPDSTYECLLKQSASQAALLPQGGANTSKSAQTRYCVQAAQWRPMFR